MTAAPNVLGIRPVNTSRWFLCAELLIFFTLLPLLIYRRLIPNWPISILVAVALGAFFISRRFPNFSVFQLFQWQGARSQAFAILARDAFLMLLLGVAVWQFAPNLLFSFVRRTPILWAALMILYPVCSVLPQEFLFRAYFFRRYRELFGMGYVMIAASALAFGFVHIIFGNWIRWFSAPSAACSSPRPTSVQLRSRWSGWSTRYSAIFFLRSVLDSFSTTRTACSVLHASNPTRNCTHIHFRSSLCVNE
jgi:hypothetical protein